MQTKIFTSYTYGNNLVLRNSAFACACRQKQWQRRAIQISRNKFRLEIQLWTEKYVQDCFVGEVATKDAILWVSRGAKGFKG